MRINNNIMAMNTHRQLGMNSAAGAKSVEKLSSGFRINRAGDDAAGLAISEKMRAQIRGLNQASRNSQDSISLIQTAEGAVNETHAILQRMRELAVQSANDTNVDVDREQIQQEMNQLTTEVNRIGNTTEFNTMKLLNGDRGKTVNDGATATSALKAGTVNVAAAVSGYTTSGDTSLKDAVGEITIVAGEYLSAAGTTTGDRTIDIVKTASGYDVTVSAGTGTTTFSADDTLTADVNGDFVYSNHGISFTITAEEDADVTVGDDLNITDTGTAVETSYAADSAWNIAQTGAGTVAISNNEITVVQNADNADIRSITIEATSASFTVTLGDAASGGNTVQVDVYSYTAEGTSLTYNDHGISFTIANTLSANATASAVISLTGLGTEDSYASTDYTDNSIKFQVGANQNQSMDLAIGDMRADALDISSTTAGAASGSGDPTSYGAVYTSSRVVTDGTNSTSTEYALDVSTHENAAAAVSVINDAIEDVSSQRAKLGAVQNRLEYTIKNLDTSAENLQAAESRIRDVDMAKEMMTFTKNNILQQAAQSMLAQANQAPQGVLQLLR